MNPTEYSQLARKLQDQLDQRGGLIRFHVPELDEYLEKYPVMYRGMMPQTLAVEWSVKIENKELRGSALFTIEIILRSTDVIAYILDCAIMQINHAILNPKEVLTT